jgi:cytochrome c-type biogenesis protein CcmH
VAALFVSPFISGGSLHGESKVMASRIPFVLSGPRALPGKAASFWIAAVIFVLLVATSGCIREEDITLEQRAHQLAAQLMCPVCDGQTIDGSSAQISQDMRLKVRELLDRGDTNAEIKDYFVLRYGPEILAAPEGSGFNLLAWIVPVFIVVGGVGIALLAIKNMRNSGMRAQKANVEVEDDLSEYLAQVDRDLGNSTEMNSTLIETSDKLENPDKEANS